MISNVQDLLEKAADLYNQGSYDRAIDTWKEVLGIDPENQKAQEGIRMAGLLRSTEALSRSAREREGNEISFTDRIQAIKGRVRELVQAGDEAEAKEGCTLLEDLAPDDPEVVALCEWVRKGAATAGKKAPAGKKASTPGEAGSLLDVARDALEGGRVEEAARAASEALENDPSNMEAAGILSMTGGATSGDGTISIGTDDSEDIPGPMSLDAMLSGDEPSSRADDETGTEAQSEEAVFEPTSVADLSPADRVATLLKTGQRAFDAGRPQEAIEIWSRIFALDESNDDASARIDKARAVLEDQGRAIEELMHQACDAQEAGRLETALELFRKVRAMSPLHAEAGVAIEELMERLTGEAAPINLDLDAVSETRLQPGPDPDDPMAPIALDAEPAPSPSTPAGDEIQEIPLDLEPDAPAPDPPKRDPMPPAASETAPRPAPPGRAPLGRGARVFLAVSGGFFLLVVALGAWVWFGFGGSVPEAQATIPAPPAPHAAGTPEITVEVPSTSAPGVASPRGATPSPPPASGRSHAKDHAREGARLYREGNWAGAVQELMEARRLDPLFAQQEMLDDALRQLEDQAEFEKDTAAATQYFAEGDYASSLYNLYRLQQKFGTRRPFDLYIRNAWFNWGVLLMQAGSVDEAIEKFNEVIDLNRKDREAVRAREVARRYQERQRDMAYDMYVNDLKLRSMDQR